MKKQILTFYMLVSLVAFTSNCAKKQVSQTSTNDQSQATTTTTTTSTATSAAADLNAYVGTYKMQSDEFESVTITLEDNKLFGQASGQPKSEIKPSGKDTFDVPDFGARVVFSRDDNQKVKGITIYVNGAEVSGDKVE